MERITSADITLWLRLWAPDLETNMEHTLECTTMTAPSYWTCYLVNGDASSLGEAEQVACDAWIASLDGWSVIDVARDDNGEPLDSDFRRSHDASAFSPLAGDVTTYILHRHT